MKNNMMMSMALATLIVGCGPETEQEQASNEIPVTETRQSLDDSCVLTKTYTAFTVSPRSCISSTSGYTPGGPTCAALGTPLKCGFSNLPWGGATAICHTVANNVVNWRFCNVTDSAITFSAGAMSAAP
jgi:hypothetical protein